jgi:hypothetical protein
MLIHQNSKVRKTEVLDDRIGRFSIESLPTFTLGTDVLRNNLLV